MNLFEIEAAWIGTGSSSDKPRSATDDEVGAYLTWLAERAGLDTSIRGERSGSQFVTFGERIQKSGNVEQVRPCYETFTDKRVMVWQPEIWAEGSYSVPMPGRNGPGRVTMDEMDEAGEIVRTLILPSDKNGRLPIDAAKVRALVPVPKKPRASRKPVQRVEPETAVTVHATAAPISAASDGGLAVEILARLDMLGERMTSLETARPAPGEVEQLRAQLDNAREACTAYAQTARDLDGERIAERRARVRAVRSALYYRGLARLRVAPALPKPSADIVPFPVPAGQDAEPLPYTITPARYSQGKLIVQCPSRDGYKTRAARLIGDGLNCGFTGRSGGYIASVAKARKFEMLYADGWDASSFTGKLSHDARGLRDLTVGEALKAMETDQRAAA